MAKPVSIEVWNPNGKYRVVSTKPMPGTRWINLLTQQDCRVEICTLKKTILSVEDIIALIGDKCDGVIGQGLGWGETLFSALSKAGGTAFSNMVVGYNNVDVNAANKYGVAVGNTPGVLTETTEELAASLSVSAARRIVEADEFMRAGLYDGWLPHLFVVNLIKGQTVGVIGAGRIGSAYARMMKVDSVANGSCNGTKSLGAENKCTELLRSSSNTSGNSKLWNSSSGSNSSTNPERKEVCLFKHHFEFHDDQNPYTRLPFFDKIQNLAKNNPGLMTLRSTDLLPSSWKLDGCCMVTTLSPGVYSKMPLRLSAQRKVGRVQQRYIETTTLKNLKYC
ncbi:hypothetical protein POM88_009098 [Heracleum sosnowskyi]|uniref:D-isomer specific 2-hydroxyacid dehydrogenase catalytic domain-containing protein n=1 Tax=Heracleum sosnowskyi TaxID=360622 RepID=A0AAD8JB21_9APIA|nr:hypothetical protein POM88_009098 [Heracleum sosnowskyi]